MAKQLELTQPIVTGPPPAPQRPDLAPTEPQKTVIASVNPRTQYVSGYDFFTIPYPRAQTFYIDEIERDIGTDTYKKMMMDPIINSSVEGLKLAALAQPFRVTLPTGIKDPDTGGKRVLEFCERAIQRVDMFGLCLQMLDCISYGHKISEIQLQDANDPSAPQGGYRWEEIAVRPRKAIVPVVSAQMRHIGYKILRPGSGLNIMAGLWMFDPSIDPDFLVREKCFILTNRPVDNNPQGMSQLNCVYNAWYVKTQCWVLELKQLALIALPIAIGVCPQMSQSEQATDPQTGALQFDQYGNAVMLTPEQALAHLLSGLHNGSPIAVPFGTSVDFLKGTGGTEDMIRSTIEQLCDNQIRIGIMGQSLTGSVGEAGPVGSSKVHQDTKGAYVDYYKSLIERGIRKELLMPLVRLSFPSIDAELYTPQVSLSEAEKQDLPTIWAGLAQLGLKLQPEQYPEAMQQGGLPALAPDWEEKQQAAELEQQKQQAQVQGAANPGIQQEPGGKPAGPAAVSDKPDREDRLDRAA